MGHAHKDHWPGRDSWRVDEAREAGFSLAARRWPPDRSVEASARLGVLRGMGWRGPVDQDGYAVGDGVLPPLVDQFRAGIAEADSGRPAW